MIENTEANRKLVEEVVKTKLIEGKKVIIKTDIGSEASTNESLLGKGGVISSAASGEGC